MTSHPIPGQPGFTATSSARDDRGSQILTQPRSRLPILLEQVYYICRLAITDSALRCRGPTQDVGLWVRLPGATTPWSAWPYPAELLSRCPVFIAASSTLASSRGASCWTMWLHRNSWNVQPGSVRARSAEGPFIGAGGFEQYTNVLGNAAARGLARRTGSVRVCSGMPGGGAQPLLFRNGTQMPRHFLASSRISSRRQAGEMLSAESPSRGASASM